MNETDEKRAEGEKERQFKRLRRSIALATREESAAVTVIESYLYIL